MKKLLSLLLAVLLTLALVACGNTSNPQSNSYVPPEGVIYNTDYNTNENTNPSSENATTNGNFGIYGARNFSDGVAIIVIRKVIEKSNGELDYSGYNEVLIDISGNILFSISDLKLDYNNFVYNDEDIFSQYQNGIAVYQQPKYAAIRGDYIVKAIYDKKGNVVISAEKNDYDNVLAYSGDHKYFIVDKTEESFNGDSYMVGIIDNNGNYIEQMSSNNALAQMGQKAKEQNLTFNVTYVQDDIFYVSLEHNWTGIVEQCYYHVNSKKTTNNYNHVEHDPYGYLYQYDESGNRTQLFADKTIVRAFYNAVLITATYYNEYKLIDYNGNLLMDLSNYKLKKQQYENSSEAGFYYQNGYLLTQIENSTGGLYCCMFDAEGNLVFEPIRMQEDDHFYPLNPNGFIYKTVREDGTKVYHLYKYDGTIKELKYVPTDIYGSYAPDIHDEGSYSFVDGLEVIHDIEKDESFFINDQEEIVISGKTIKGSLD